MLEGYKTSLSYINSLMWILLSVCAGLILLDPTSSKINLLGFSFDQSLSSIIGPVAIVVLLLVRQIVIRNAAEIVRLAKSKKELIELTKAYPILEFIRWKAPSGLEIVLLTIFQALLGLLPSFTVIFLVGNHLQNNLLRTIIDSILGIFIALIGLWNYNTLRRKIYEPLCGFIKTPD